MKHGKVFIYGKHAVEEALTSAPRALTKVYIDERQTDKKFVAKIHSAGVPTGPLSLGLARSDMKSGAPHQGVVGQISLHALIVPYQKFTDALPITEHTCIVFLSGVQDPHNAGAIIRSAAAFGASAILMPEKGNAPISGAVIKVSAGMAFKVPLVEVENVQQCLSDLKKRGFKIYALAGEGKTSITEEKFSEPAVFILGNEGEGVPTYLRELCDSVLSIPISTRTESLNVAASAAVALYAWSTKHHNVLS